MNLTAFGGTNYGCHAHACVGMFTAYRYTWPLRSGHGAQNTISYTIELYKLQLQGRGSKKITNNETRMTNIEQGVQCTPFVFIIAYFTF